MVQISIERVLQKTDYLGKVSLVNGRDIEEKIESGPSRYYAKTSQIHAIAAAKRWSSR